MQFFRIRRVAVFNFCLLLVCLAVNILAEVFPVNGISTPDLRKEVNSWYIPADFIYWIKPVIFLLLLVNALYFLEMTFRNDANASGFVDLLHPLYGLMFLLQPLWLVAFQYRLFLTAQCFLVALQLVLIFIMLRQVRFRNRFAQSAAERFLLGVPLSLYSGWMTVVCISGFAHLFAATFHISAIGLGLFWLVLTFLFFLLFLFVFKDPAAAFAPCWTLVGLKLTPMVGLPYLQLYQSVALILTVACGISYLLYALHRLYRYSVAY